MHKHHFVSKTPAPVGAVIEVAELGGKTQPARVLQANPNGDLIVELTDSKESPKQKVWASTVETLPEESEAPKARGKKD